MKSLFKFLALGALLIGLLLPAQASQSNTGSQLPALQLSYVKNAVDPVGKPLLLEFWATWCPPCRKSIPHLNEIYAKYKDRGLLIIGVSDEEKSVVEPFMQKLPMNYSVALDANGKLGSSFGIEAIPHAMLVDKSGKIVWEGHPMELTDEAIEKILK
jgi:thiol-disulfide isomerase/thioredoxin